MATTKTKENTTDASKSRSRRRNTEGSNVTWLSCQILPEESQKFDDYCTRKRISKTQVIRDLIENLDSYFIIIELLKKQGLKTLAKQLTNTLEEIGETRLDVLPDDKEELVKIEEDIKQPESLIPKSIVHPSLTIEEVEKQLLASIL